MPQSPEFVIWTPPFDEYSGGSILLHTLCDRLRALGYAAAIWPDRKPRGGVGPRRLRKTWQWNRAGGDNGFAQGPYDNPIATEEQAKRAVFVYPEVIAGNPLGSQRVVRWLLHKPGYHTGHVEFGSADLFFFHQVAFNDPALNVDPDTRLSLNWLNPVYHDRGERRSGSCYMLRKGANRPIVHDLAGSIPLDGKSHAEIAAVFNQTERFYCYDLYTAYAWYAAISGCVPIVVPDPTLAIDHWFADPTERWGIAYGEENIPWARETRQAMLDRGRNERIVEDALVANFANKCRQRWPVGLPASVVSSR